MAVHHIDIHARAGLTAARVAEPIIDAIHDGQTVVGVAPGILLRRVQPWIDATGDEQVDMYLAVVFRELVLHGAGLTALGLLDSHMSRTTDIIAAHVAERTGDHQADLDSLGAQGKQQMIYRVLSKWRGGINRHLSSF